MLSRLIPAALFGLAIVAIPVGHAAAKGRQAFGGSDAGCSVESAYGLQVDARGIHLEADDDQVSPRRVRFRDGVLHVDGALQPLSADDAQRLREIEAGTRALLPEIAGITREAVGIAFDTLGSVNAALTGNQRQAREFERLRGRALARVDETLGRGHWNPATFGDEFEAEIEAAAEAMAAGFTPRRAIWMVLTGGVGRMERRMEKMEVELERSIAARETTLERHASAVCGRLEGLEALQQAMQFRLDDGRALRVFEYRTGNDAHGTLQAAGD